MNATMENGNDLDHELATLDQRLPNLETLPAPIAAGYAVQQVRSTYATAMAVQRARSIGEIRRRLLEEARLAGEDFYYGWGAGKDRIEGPSVDLAVAAARCWGNCATEPGPIQETRDAWIFTYFFIDLETGYTRGRQFRQSKTWTIHGKLDAARKDDVRFLIGQSKAERNVILKALPPSLITEAMEEAKSGVRKKLEAYVKEKGGGDIGKAAAIDLLVRALAKLGVKEPQILARCDVAAIGALTLDHLVILKGNLAAIQKGQERAEDIFPTVKEAPGPDPLAEKLGIDKATEEKPAKPAKKKPESDNLKPKLDRIIALRNELDWTPEEIERTAKGLDIDAARMTEPDADKLIAALENELRKAQNQE